MSRILVAGYYGYGNLGDELILASMVARLRAERPDVAITVVSASPAETAARHGVEAADWSDIRALVAAVQGCDVVVLGGGGLFHDYWGCDPEALLQRHHAGLPQYLGPCLLAAVLEKPLMIYAAGVGPLFGDSGRGLTRAAFDQASAATVRDAGSRALLAEIGVDVAGVAVTADPAFDSPHAAVGSPLPPSAAPTVAVALRNWSHGVRSDHWEGQVAEALDAFHDRHGGEAVFVPFQDAGEPFGDAPVAERVRARMKPGRHRLLSSDALPAERLSVLASADVVLGMRLHSLVMAARAGRPLVALAYDAKVAAAMDRLGAADATLDLGGLLGARLAATLDEAWRSRQEKGARVAAAAGELAGPARDNTTRLLALADSPPVPRIAPAMAVLLQRATVPLAMAADVVSRKAEDEMGGLRDRAEAAEAEVQRWESSTAGHLMRVWRRWRG